MGGCKGDESTCSAEVFDPKTQTWEPLPDPGVELRWEVYRAKFGESICKIDEVWYSYDQRECWWYDTKCRKWRLVRGLTELCRRFSRELGVEIGSYGGKLVIFWVGPALYPFLGTSRIWCAVILLKKHCGRYNEVWGQVEWADIVLTAPWSHAVRLRCVKSVQ
ncbi:hypothetical protein DY000_02037443 [Brassica cretica]|uniref:FKB95-like N-terminal Kelch domain-containing protein n=1 Tax=Brassica cretica TaxID=69181 RepID=A0ABQ7B9L5_BRACR|nr:hypothetical protein DY000_02037443 [Brassica cretica]